MGYVYKITNTINNKAYIGISVHEPEKRRIRDHLSGRGNRIIAKAVEKYGKDAFTYEILEANVFPELLPDLEVAYIANFNTVAPHGYNLTHGGEGNSCSEETRRKLSGERHHFFGKQHSKEVRAKISKTLKGRALPEETKQKISKTMKGSTRPEETKQKISRSKKGKPLPEETKRKVSETMKRSGTSKGEKNPNFHPDHIAVREYFFSLPSDMPMTKKRELLHTKFQNIQKATISRWIRKWQPNSEDYRFVRHHDHIAVREYFFLLPPDMSLTEKRKSLYTTFRNVSKSTIQRWVRKWLAS